MERLYVLPDKMPGETSVAWCNRAAASIPPASIVTMLIDHMDAHAKKRGEAWSQLGAILGHGSGVSSAIVRLYRRKERSPVASEVPS